MDEATSKPVAVTFVRHYKLVEHVCPECGEPFAGPRLRVYCSSACKQKAAWKRHGAEWNINRNERKRAARSDVREKNGEA